MYRYEKRLIYPIHITHSNVEMAQAIFSALGGYAGELAASLRYFFQSFGMPDDTGRALLQTIATEELGHVEMISAMLDQLLEGASLEELKRSGLLGYYTQHGKGIYPVDACGVPFDVNYFASSGNPVADLCEDMAAEEKARAGYENLLSLTDDPELIGPLLFLRQREIVHYNRFKSLYERYKKENR